MQTAVVLSGLLILVAPSLAGPAAAQQSKKASDVDFLPVEPPQERAYRPWDPYSLSVRLEVGGQIVDVSGNQDVYNSHQNYRDGFRVFDFNIRGKGQNGALLTDFYVDGGGWVNEPYSWARFGFSKDNWFDFRGSFRESEYNWLFPGFARSQHANDTERRLQTYDLTLFPKKKVRVKLGYSRNSSFGLALTSLDFSRDEFPLFEPIRQTYDEYRIGAEWTVARWNFFTQYNYRFVRNDREFSLVDDFDPGNNPTNNTSLSRADRLHPIRAKVPSVRFTVAGRPRDTLEVTARILYSDISMDATRDELNVGIDRSGNPTEITTGTTAEGSRPSTVADGAVTWRPVRGLSISNTFRFNQFTIAGFQMTGFSTFDPVGGTTTLSGETFQSLLKFKSYLNRLEGRYDFNRSVGVRVGYLYTTRDVSMQHIEDGVPEPLEDTELDTNTLLLGANFRVNRKFRLFFDWEHGTFDNVFTRLSAADIDRVRVRTRWQPVRGVRFNTSWFLFDSTNPNPLINSDQENRGYSLDFQFSRFDRGYLNLGYARNDINSVTDIEFFIGGGLGLQRATSIYVANDNYAYADFGGRIVGNLYGDAGYRVVFNAGTFPASDPVGACVTGEVGSSCDNTPVLDPLNLNRGGLNYHQPHAALRYAFSDNVSWKAGWRWYGYNVKQGTLSDYKAHIVTTSLVLNF